MDERAQQQHQIHQVQMLRDTMIRQEMIFKEQVRELHRLYQKQKILMAAIIKPKPPLPAAAPAHHQPPPTRDFLNILNKNSRTRPGDSEHDDYSTCTAAPKRRKLFDLEQLPDDTDEDPEEDVELGEQRRRMNSSTSSSFISQVLDFRENHHKQQDLWNDRHTLQEMPLFPIPNRVASTSATGTGTGTGAPVVVATSAVTSTVGSNGGLDTKNGISQQPVRWVNQGFGSSSGAPQPCNLAVWKDLIGAQQVAADRSQNYHQRQHLAVPSYNTLIPDASAACLQFNNVLATLRPQQKSYVSPNWPAYSYFTPEPSAASAFTGFKNGFSLDPNYRNPMSDNSRSSCFSGISTAVTQQQPVWKPPVPIFEKTEEPSIRKFAAVSADVPRERDHRSAVLAERENEKGGIDVNADAASAVEQKMREDERIRHPEGGSSPKCVDKVAVSSDRLAESVGGTTGASCTGKGVAAAADSPGKVSETLVVAVDGFSANNTAGTQESTRSRSQIREEECVDGSSAACLAVNNETIVSAATILLSLAPEDDDDEEGDDDEIDERGDVHHQRHQLRSCAGKRHSGQESSSNLLSDVKLFKSVVIMLKQSGAAKTSSKKVVVASKSFGKASNVINGSKTFLRTIGMGQTQQAEHQLDQSASKPKSSSRKESVQSNDSTVATNSSNTMIKRKAASSASASVAVAATTTATTTTTRITKSSSSSSWIWGEVTRRKRMQRQRHHAFGSKVQVQS